MVLVPEFDFKIAHHLYKEKINRHLKGTQWESGQCPYLRLFVSTCDGPKNRLGQGSRAEMRFILWRAGRFSDGWM